MAYQLGESTNSVATAIDDLSRQQSTNRSNTVDHLQSISGVQRIAMSASTIIAVLTTSFATPFAYVPQARDNTAFHTWTLDIESSAAPDISEDEIELDSPKSLKSEFAALRNRGFVRINDPRKAQN